MKNLSIMACTLILSLSGYSQKFDLGKINGADYFICIPENWNGGLLMYAHGYISMDEETEPFVKEVNDFVEIFTSRGFAYAYSAYRRKGLVLKEGVEDTEALRSYFESTYGIAETTIITGHSMGGMITIATIERYPAEYDGAMPLCGWLAPAHSLFKNVLDMLVTYDYLFGDNNGEIVTGDQVIEADIIRERLEQKPELARLYGEHFRIRIADLAEMIEFNQFVSKETVGWLGGLPVGNLLTIYSGFGDRDTSLNKNVLRYAKDPEASEYTILYNTPSGMISDPVLALHTTYDALLPVYNYSYYEQITEIRQTSDLYMQQYVVRDGHCYFSLEETGEAFDQLLNWIETGKRPELIYR